MGVVVEVEQRGDLRVDNEHDAAAVTAVATVGSAQRLELLAVDGGAAVTAGPRRHVDDHPVDEAAQELPFGTTKGGAGDRAALART
jgi:hypothetical protein